jgi:prevent-host-death family protein
MATVNIHEAKTHLSRLIERARRGERIVIAKAGTPVAVLTGIESEVVTRRPIGMDRGRIVIHPNFDDPLPEFDPDYSHPDDPLAGDYRR